jgi:hypothetical protein
MTTKDRKNPKTVTNSPSRPNVEFVNYDLNKEQRAAFSRWAHENVDEMFALMERVSEDGYNLSLKYDDRQGCHSAFLTPREKDNPNFGLILTARASTAFATIAAVLYRHFVLFDANWNIPDLRRGGLDDLE